MRRLLVALSIALFPIVAAQAQVSIEFGSRGVSIGIDVTVYPRLVRVPGYPVYYDPQASSNYFFYDGLFWVYQSDEWYASNWYNGPWELVGPEDVPLYLLRVPVRYYRHPPSYFRGWRADAPPRWDEHWGREWEQRRSGWDHWDRRSVPAPAPLPTYQRQYSGARYPGALDQQATIREQHYRYQPREAVTRQHFQQPGPRQTSPGSSQAEPSRQAPIQQRSQPSQPRQQTQAPQPRTEQPVQRTQPTQQAQPEQPRQSVQREPPRQSVQQSQQPASPAQVHRAPQGKGQETDKHAPQGQGGESRPSPQGKGKGQENAPQGKGQENKAAAHGKGEESKKDERDQGRQ